MASLNKLVLYGLARYAMSKSEMVPGLKIPATGEAFATAVRGDLKTVREQLSRLRGQRVFERTQEGFVIPEWALGGAMRQLGGGAEIRKR